MAGPSTTPGMYNVFTADGRYVGWWRHYKDAKYAAERVGGKAIKVPAEAKAGKAWDGPLLKLEDGTLVPFTRANLKAAQQKQNPAGRLPRNKWVPGKVMVTSGGKVQFIPSKPNAGIKFSERADGWYWNVSGLTGAGYGPFPSAQAAEDNAYRRGSVQAKAKPRIERDKSTGRFYRV